MTRRSLAFASAATLAAFLLLAPGRVLAAQGDCSQPFSTGDNPTTTDCLILLQIAVSLTTCEAQGWPTCQTCDVDNSDGANPVTATDSLICINKATLQPIDLNCQCPTTSTVSTTSSTSTTTPTIIDRPQCSSSLFISKAGSDLDAGWNGLGHNSDVIEGAEIKIDNIKRCSNNGALCRTDLDCSAGATCDLTCACDSPNDVCDITGPTGASRCTGNLQVCATDGNCPAGQLCRKFFGPPLPLAAGGVPTCVTTYFAEPLTGTANATTGEGSGTSFLRSVVYLGIGEINPCPRCGTTAQNPEIGDQFTCGGGPNQGQTCTVGAISADYGGVSFDCPPPPASNVSGIGLAIVFKEVTTGSVEEQATIPCAPPLNVNHPGVGGPSDVFCLDDFSQCSTNADCMRCTNDLTPCSSNGDCSGGTCAAAPDQPVSCGIYCHCGYCDDDANQPCFSDADCDSGETCGPGTGSQPGGTGPLQQVQANGCNNFLCGEQDADQCCSTGDTDCINADFFGETPLTGECSLATFRTCTTDSQCASTGSGTCVLSRRPCFPQKLEGTGTPDPLHRVCLNYSTGTGPPCTDDADCPMGVDCVDISDPVTVGLFCIPPTSNPSINNAGGIPGPGRIAFSSLIVVGRCGDGNVNGGEECDDGNLVNDDGCSQDCLCEPGSTVPGCPP